MSADKKAKPTSGFLQNLTTGVQERIEGAQRCFRDSPLIPNYFKRMLPSKELHKKPHHGNVIDLSSAIQPDIKAAEAGESGEVETRDGHEVYRPHKGDENEERGNWSHPAEFIISCIGFAVGLGNVWRFPYMCYRNGGGAFVLIYWILSATVGFPIIVLEQCIGQYTSLGPLHCWQFAPFMTGVGISMVAVSFVTVIYYDVVITWGAYYLFASFTSQLPWETCDYSSWADFRCEMSKVDCNRTAEFGEIRGDDGLCYNSTEIGHFAPAANTFGPGFSLPRLVNTSAVVRNSSTVLGYWNDSMASERGFHTMLASEQYYHNYVLGDGDPFYGLDNIGTPRWGLVLCMLLIWVLVFFSLINGIKSSGKIVYFTCLAPYVVLFVLIVRGATLPGAYNGIMYFLTPDFERIKQPEVWYAAAGQLFYSLSACWGGMVTLASYNRFHNNIIRDAVIVVFADTFTSFFASFAVFSVIGYGAYILDRPVEKVVKAGTGLAFVVYPKVITQFPGSTAFAIIFFFMIICLGLDSEFNMAETVFTALLDLFPKLRKDFRTKSLTFAGFCIICFLLGLPFICPGGTKLFGLFDDYCATWAILLMGLLECISICWIYGFKRFTKDLKVMMHWLPELPAQIFMVIFWGFVTPGVLAYIMIYIWVKYEGRTDQTEEGLGWFLTWIVACWMPLTVIYLLVMGKGNIWQRILAIFTPSHRWGPYLEKFRKEAKHLEVLQAQTSLDLIPVKVEQKVGSGAVDGPESCYYNDAIELNEWHHEISYLYEEQERKPDEAPVENAVSWTSPISRIVIEGEWVQEL